MNVKIVILVLLGLAGLGAYMTIFIVDEREIALKFKFGEVVRVYTQPGLHFMIPVVNNIKKFDKRLLDLDEPAQSFTTGDQKQVSVDYFVKWRINQKDRKGEAPGSNIIRFYRANSGSVYEAKKRLTSVINDALNTEFQSRTVIDVIWKDRIEIMKKLVILANQKVNGDPSKDDEENYGIEVVDVRIKQIEYNKSVEESIYTVMIRERGQRATELRARGNAQAEKIKAIAEKERTIIKAIAKKTALTIKGQGDGQSAKIYADGHGKNKEFYAFYRSLKAYENTWKENDMMVLDPSSEFFKYFDQSKVTAK